MLAVPFDGTGEDQLPDFMVQMMDLYALLAQMMHVYAWQGHSVCDSSFQRVVFEHMVDQSSDIFWLRTAMAVKIMNKTRPKKLVTPRSAPRSRPARPPGAPLPLQGFDEDSLSQKREEKRYRDEVFSKARISGIGILPLNELQLVFNELNINHDTVLDVDELTGAYIVLSGKPKDEANKTAQDALASIDIEGITFPEFMEWVRKPDPEITNGETEEAKPLSEPAATAKGNKPDTEEIDTDEVSITSGGVVLSTVPQAEAKAKADAEAEAKAKADAEAEAKAKADAEAATTKTVVGTLFEAAAALMNPVREQNSSGGESKETEENAMKDGQIWRRRRRKMDTSGEYGYENQTWYKVRVKGDVLALVRFKPGDDPPNPDNGI